MPRSAKREFISARAPVGRFAAEASSIGGLIGAWEAALLVAFDAELTTSRAGAALLAGGAFVTGAVLLGVAGVLFALLGRAGWARKIFRARPNAVAFGAAAAAAFYGAFYLNEKILPGKLHPLSLACDLAVLIAASLVVRFVPRFKIKVSRVAFIYIPLAAAAFGVAALAAGGTRRLGPPPVNPPSGSLNLVLITMDTTRADRVHPWALLSENRELTPNLKRLLKNGNNLILRAYCPMPLTGPSHATILTGRTPRELGVVQNGVPLPERADTLAEVLRRRGYRTGAVVGAFPVSSKLGFAQGFEFFDDDFSPRDAFTRLTVARAAGALALVNAKAELQRRAGDVTKRATKWLGGVADEPFFLWVHYYDPHTPYDPPADYRDISKAADEQVRLYDGEVAYMDAQIGVLLAQLSKRQLLDKTAVVAVADHGESLGEHDYYYDHGRDVYDPCMQVPLIIAWAATYRPPDPVYLELKTDWEYRGQLGPFPLVPLESLYGYFLWGLENAGSNATAGSNTPHYLGRSHVFGEASENGRNLWMVVTPVINPRGSHNFRKLIYNPGTGETKLYNLGNDWRELDNLSAKDPETTARLLATLKDYFNDQPPLPGAAAIDKATKEKLRSLGYM